MNITIHKSELNKHLNIASGIIDRNPTIVALTGIKFIANNNTLTLIASNGDVSVKVLIANNVEIKEEGELLVDGKYISDATSKLDGFINIYVENNHIKIKSDKTNYKLNSVDVNSYPNIDFTYDSDNEIAINGNELVHTLEKVINSVSTTASRPILTGVNIKAVGTQLEFTATDSYRLSKAYLEIDNEVDLNVNILATTLKNIMKIAKDKVLYISTDDKKVIFRTNNDDIIYTTRMIEGMFPDVDILIPKVFNTYIELNRENLIKGIDRASLMKEDNVWITSITTQNDSVSLDTKAKQVVSTHETLPATITGNDMTINLNGSYLIDALNALEDELIKISLVGDLNALTVSDSTRQVQLLLPVRVA